jgi:DNA-binding IclR family transcriptional regulator
MVVTPRGQHPRGTQVVSRVIDILELIAQADAPLSISEISRGVGLKYSTTHRIVDAMTGRGILSRDSASRRYQAGTRLRELALGVAERTDLLGRARPILEALSAEVGESTHLSILERGVVHFIHTVEAPRMLSQHSHVRERVPLHCTADGKVLLAELDPHDLATVLDRGLDPYTPNTLTERSALTEELSQVRAHGYAVDNEEIELGLVGVAAPVRNPFGRAVAAVSVGGPSSRMRQIGLTDVARLVRDAAFRIEQAMGWTQPATSSALDAHPAANPSS